MNARDVATTLPIRLTVELTIDDLRPAFAASMVASPPMRATLGLAVVCFASSLAASAPGIVSAARDLTFGALLLLAGAAYQCRYGLPNRFLLGRQRLGPITYEFGETALSAYASGAHSETSYTLYESYWVRPESLRLSSPGGIVLIIPARAAGDRYDELTRLVASKIPKARSAYFNAKPSPSRPASSPS